ncbi:MAG: 30S ribosomal protein S2 [Alphaproteobacteria bacterium GM7ARS4]|nr:30S ribosomal protein S2 [Alphaproteobacteria bacterium GM7ARS4]
MKQDVSFTMRDLLEAGVHFGHRVHRWNPHMREFIYGKIHGSHIINLDETVSCLRHALIALEKVARRKESILFVGTKRRASDIIAAEARRCRQHYVHHRWLGGMLTNWKTVSASTRRLHALSEERNKSDSALTKKERLRIEREYNKLERALGGIKNMEGQPSMLFVIDTVKEAIAVSEANKLRIPVVAVTDTNADPAKIQYPIPGNDDSLKAIRLYARLAANAVLKGSGETPWTEETVPDMKRA